MKHVLVVVALILLAPLCALAALAWLRPRPLQLDLTPDFADIGLLRQNIGNKVTILGRASDNRDRLAIEFNAGSEWDRHTITINGSALPQAVWSDSVLATGVLTCDSDPPQGFHERQTPTRWSIQANAVKVGRNLDLPPAIPDRTTGPITLCALLLPVAGLLIWRRRQQRVISPRACNGPAPRALPA